MSRLLSSPISHAPTAAIKNRKTTTGRNSSRLGREASPQENNKIISGGIMSANPHLQSIGAILQLAGIAAFATDRKSTRLNSSHLVISYAVFCLKKKKY